MLPHSPSPEDLTAASLLGPMGEGLPIQGGLGEAGGAFLLPLMGLELEPLLHLTWGAAFSHQSHCWDLRHGEPFPSPPNT